jgi:integrase
VSRLADAAADYLAVRRALGFKLADHGWLLADFVAFAERAGAPTVTAALALTWATGSAGTQTWRAARLSVVRGFAAYLRTLDPATEVPATGLLRYQRRRAEPYLYSDADIAGLLAAAWTLGPPLRAGTYHTLVGLIAASGLRVGEAIRLDRDHVDLHDGVLAVWLSKFDKSREVPLHPSTTAALQAYAEQRDRICPDPATTGFFVSTRGTRLEVSVVHKTFRTLCRRSGLHDPQAPGRPRLIDLRHSFAVRSLADWYRAGVEVQARMPRLSTYMGHVEPSSTYWYLSTSTELMASAAQRLEASLGELP